MALTSSDEKLSINPYTYPVKLLGLFLQLYAKHDRWWHYISPRHFFLKHKLWMAWAGIVISLKQLEIDYHNDDKNKTFWSKRTYIDLPEKKGNDSYMYWHKVIRNYTLTEEEAGIIQDAWGSNTEESRRVLVFNLLASGEIANHSYVRILLYVIIGCTPEMISDYRDLPLSYLIEVANLLNTVKQ